jgi:hypothetical protein
VKRAENELNKLYRSATRAAGVAPLDLNLLKSKSVIFVWEFMFTRSMHQTPNIGVQGSFSTKSPH